MPQGNGAFLNFNIILLYTHKKTCDGNDWFPYSFVHIEEMRQRQEEEAEEEWLSKKNRGDEYQLRLIKDGDKRPPRPPYV